MQQDDAVPDEGGAVEDGGKARSPEEKKPVYDV